MRIPPSVIIMSLLTAAPFGKAIHDTMTKKSIEEIEADERAEMLRLEKQWEEEAHARELERQAEEAERNKKKVAAFDTLLGTTPASMGSLFEGVTFGKPEGESVTDDAYKRTREVESYRLIEIAYRHSAVAQLLESVQITIVDHEYDVTTDKNITYCEPFEKRLTAMWGPPTNTNTWFDTAKRVRAHFDHEHGSVCELTFSKYVEPAEWVASLKLETMNKKNPALYETASDDTAQWELAGIGGSSTPTAVEAYFDEKQRVVAISASLGTDPDSAYALRDALAAKLGSKPKRDTSGDYEYSGTEHWVWKKPFPVSLELSSTGAVALTVGRSPWE